MTIKKLIIVLVTIISLFPVILALVSSVNQPQVQSNLQLYQTNLILQAAELSNKTLDKNNSAAVDLVPVKTALLGNNPYSTAQSQYQEVKKITQENLETLSKKLTKKSENPHPDSNKVLAKTQLNSNKNLDQKELKKQIAQEEKFLGQIDLYLGIIEAKQDNTEQAIQLWDGIVKQSSNQVKLDSIETATVLKALWTQPPKVPANTEQTINNQLKGWFRNESLKQFYQVTEQKQDLLALQNQENETATQAITKLALVGAIPIISGLFGVGILVILMTQLFIKGKSSILANNNNLSWETPWDWEVIWLVLIAGFFFIGQIILPVVFGFTGSIFKLSITTLDLRYKAIYVLVTYLSMAITGILVLYFSIKPFFPLPKDWFQFKWLSNWILWGIGGYFVAFPLVVIVSLVNQQIWQGKGGSNPLLLLALESQDKIALIIFFITASLAAPLFEEVIFRGFLLPSLTRYLPVWGAIIVSSLIFALAHLNLSEVLPLAILGIVLGFVYTRSRNLLSSMLLHSLWNSGTLISLFILGSGNG